MHFIAYRKIFEDKGPRRPSGKLCSYFALNCFQRCLSIFVFCDFFVVSLDIVVNSLSDSSRFMSRSEGILYAWEISSHAYNSYDKSDDEWPWQMQ